MTSFETFSKKSLWARGSATSWYNAHKMSWQKVFKKSLIAYIGLELIVYLVLYFIINILYRTVLEKDQQAVFEKIVMYFSRELSPLSRDLTFLLGFYVSLVIKRWWEQYRNLPWPDKIALLNTALTIYETEDAKRLSEELLRYIMLAYVLCLRKVSKVLKKEFSSSEDLIDARLATVKEIKMLEEKGEPGMVWWIPLHWAMHSVKRARIEKTMPCDFKEMLGAITHFWQKLETVESHQHVPIPPVYRQVVHLAVYVYFAAGLVGNQVLETSDGADIYFPFFLVFKFIFFVGWLKVAEALKNPFGDDGDDFEIGPLLSRHIWAGGVHLDAGYRGLPDDYEEEDKTEFLALSIHKEE